MCEALEIGTMAGVFSLAIVGLNIIRKLQDSITLKQETLMELKKLNSKMSFDMKKENFKQPDTKNDELKKKRDISRLRP